MTFLKRELIAWLLSIGLAFGALSYYSHTQRELGRLEERAAQFEARSESLAVKTGAIDTLYIRDTLRLRADETAWKNKVAVLETNIQRWQDSVQKLGVSTLDTVPVSVEQVNSIIDAGAQALESCRDVVRTCELRVALRDSALAVQQLTIDALKRLPKENNRSRWTERLLWVGGLVVVWKLR